MKGEPLPRLRRSRTNLESLLVTSSRADAGAEHGPDGTEESTDTEPDCAGVWTIAVAEFSGADVSDLGRE